MTLPKKIDVVVVMGSQSDLPVMKAAAKLLEGWGIAVSTEIVSAHRTPDLLQSSAARWQANGAKVIIAGAGGAAHLPGMLASFSIIPVIGVPVRSRAMNGLDSLLSIAQMPKGVPVATVAVDNAFNAGLLAAQILGAGDSKAANAIRSKVAAYKKTLKKSVGESRKRLLKLGVERFLKS
jgi:5-(carboxyamino)imidazole ribonucleotide mutase